MSVVAGCSLFDGVLLAADCRVTLSFPGREDVHLDCAQKIFPLSRNTALGFVGSVQAASLLIRCISIHLRNRQRNDAINLSLWLPRLLKFSYAQNEAKIRDKKIAFMVASVIADHPNIVEREAVIPLVKRIGFGESRFKRNWIPDILVKILQTDPKHKFIRIQGTSRGLLYIMESPLFRPQWLKPLQFGAIGSGKGSIVTIAEYHDMIVAAEPGNPLIEGHHLSGRDKRSSLGFKIGISRWAPARRTCVTRRYRTAWF